MENTNGKNIGDVLSLIESQSLKCKINSNNKYPIVFKDIGDTKYSFINGLPNVIIKCELRFIKTKYNSNVPLLNNVTFPSIFIYIYIILYVKNILIMRKIILMLMMIHLGI